MSLAMLLEQIRQDRGLDLELYKRTFLERRLAIRMHACQCGDYATYAELLRREPSEYEPLLNALRIHVTCFFRDESTFEALRTKILPALFQARAAQRKLRLWCAGAASGEEPYSLAMLVCSLLGPDLRSWQVNIEASDIDHRSIERARRGQYSAHSFKEIGPELQRLVDTYTPQVGGHRQALPVLGSLVTFRVHDLTRDACQPDLDLILCRNVLIYFDRLQQERLYQAFHQALRPQGYLVLGKSEILPINWARRFVPVDLREHIYQRAA
jgi:chemotaxis methyl-accepting protein methylase